MTTDDQTYEAVDELRLELAVDRGHLKSSQYIGVYWDREKKRFRATIEVDGKRIRCGRYAREIDAAKAYDMAAVEHGVPERQNFKEEV